MTGDVAERLLGRWRREQQEPFEGWDFSYLAGRYSEDQPPWSYDALARQALSSPASSVLDMGTGGGEKLLQLADALPDDTVAIEGWRPNLPVARRSLEPRGISVVDYDAEASPHMPFPDGRFDLVLNRHEAYAAAEVARVLKPGGVFLTQQVDGTDMEEARALFGGDLAYPHVNLPSLADAAHSAGLRVEESGNWAGQAAFADVGALVYYFSAVPWSAPDDFTVDAYAPVLLRLHECGPPRGAPITFTVRRFYLRARRPVGVHPPGERGGRWTDTP